jgi:hypothetical protein
MAGCWSHNAIANELEFLKIDFANPDSCVLLRCDGYAADGALITMHINVAVVKEVGNAWHVDLFLCLPLAVCGIRHQLGHYDPAVAAVLAAARFALQCMPEEVLQLAHRGWLPEAML